MKKPSWLVLLLSFLLTLAASASFAAGADAPSPAFMRAEIDKANPPPSTYDLRDEGRMPPARYRPFGSNWYAMAITSLESSAITQGLASADIDLSEMYLAYFTYGDTRPGKSFTFSNDLDILAQPGSWKMATAFMSRQGAIDDTTLTFPPCSNISNCGYTPPAGNADDYPPVLQLQEVLYFPDADVSQNPDTVKQAIMEYGAVAAQYLFNPQGLSLHGDTVTYFKPLAGGTGWVYSELALVGWDDNFARALFNSSSDTLPEKNGAWLVRGTPSSELGGNDEYYWVSYEQQITDAVMFIAKPADGLRYYGHDDLGVSGYQSDAFMAANVFQAQGDETVQEIAFYAGGFGSEYYEASIYDLGTSRPSSPVKGTLLTQKSGIFPYYGYHRVALPQPVDVGAGHYFSVVLNTASPVTVETSSFFADTEPVVSPYESWFTSDGTSWTDGATYDEPRNATIKAFTSPTVSSAPVIQTSTLPAGKLKTAYSATLEASGATPITWAKASGTLPPGLSIGKNDGKISGTPTKEGIFGFTVKATNTKGSATKDLTIKVGDAPTIETERLDNATVGVNYNVTLTAKGATPITWSASGLPDGIKVSGNRLTGTPKTKNNYTVTLTAKNALGEISKDLTLDVGEKPVINDLPGGVAGEDYSATLTAEGSQPITKWEVTKKPDWLTVSGNSLRGPAPKKQGKHSVTVKATNDFGTVTKTLSITIGEPPAITTASLKSALVGTNYSGVTLKATGTAPITWTMTDAPSWLTLNEKTGALGGKPTERGASPYSVTFKATNSTMGRTDTQTLTLVVNGKPVIGTLPGGELGKPYSQTLAITGTEPVTWSVTSGKVPDGLSWSGKTLSGTPTQEGEFKFTVKASNTFDGKTNTVTKQLTIVIGSRPVIATTTLPPATLGKAYKDAGNKNVTLVATGTKNVTFTATGLPSGMTLSKGTWDNKNKVTTATLSGTPKKDVAPGNYPITVTATNDVGVDEMPLTLEVGEAPVITTTSPELAGELGSTDYEKQLHATGSGDITWELVSQPTWSELELSQDGKLSNIGRVLTAGGKNDVAGTITNVKVKARSKFGEVTQAFNVYVGEKPDITNPKNTNNLTDATAGKKYSFTLRANSPSAAGAVTWGFENLPAWLTPKADRKGNLTGELTGTPTTAATHRFTVTATNYVGTTTTTLEITVK